MTEPEFAHEVWLRSNDLAWRLNWRGHAQAVECVRTATEAGDLREAKLWSAVEARLRPRRA